jgi:hypothetical protein
MGLVSRGKMRVVAGVGVVGIAVALLLTGCSGDTPQGGTIEETTPTKTSTPSPTPSPTPTASDEEQKAIDAATQAYQRWDDAVNRMGQSPEDYTVSQMKTELHKVGGDPLANSTLSILNTYKVKGQAYGGRQSFDKISAEGVKVDAKTGKVVEPPNKQTKWVSHAKVWFYKDAWHVVEDETRSPEEKC